MTQPNPESNSDREADQWLKSLGVGASFVGPGWIAGEVGDAVQSEQLQHIAHVSVALGVAVLLATTAWVGIKDLNRHLITLPIERKRKLASECEDERIKWAQNKTTE